MAMRVKGETSDEVAGAALAMRRAMIPVDSGSAELLVDTCGTGGGAVTTFNISTAAALLAAGSGVRIAKHGNRSFTSRSGSADVLEALGVSVNVTPAAMSRALSESGLVFMFAPTLHPAMRHAGPVRKELGVPTIMNLLGPLANPAGARRQVLGVADATRLELMAGALAALGSVHAMVVHGEPGLDEISPLGRTQVVEVRDGVTSRWEINPRQFGLSGASAGEIQGGSPEENAELILAVLRGSASPAATGAVLLNAAAAIYVSGAAPSLEQSFGMAKSALEAGHGIVALEKLEAAQRQ
jgi:anthranilate phosphoribosyltransferase